MKKSLEEQAARFDELAGEFDDMDHSDAYRAAVSMVIEQAAPGPSDTVLDLGTGTGAIALALAENAGAVIGRDISPEMLDTAREKAGDAGFDNVSFGEGTFRDPGVEEGVDIVVSNFAMHHLDDEAKCAAIKALGALEPRRVVLGDVMLLGEPDPEVVYYDPEVDDPATVGVLVDAFTDAGFHVTSVDMVAEQAGVIVAERPASS